MIENLVCERIPTQDDELSSAEDAKRFSLVNVIEQVCKRIAPLWPLRDYIAVNPFLGISDQSFLEGCALMARVTHGSLAMPSAYFRQRVEQGEIQHGDLQAGLDLARRSLPAEYAVILEEWTVATVLQHLESGDEGNNMAGIVLTVADVVHQEARESNQEQPSSTSTLPLHLNDGSSWKHTRNGRPEDHAQGWLTFIVDEISKWCSAYYDEGQATWHMPWWDEPLYTAWKQAAMRDANPEVMGLKGFRAFTAGLPGSPADLIEKVVCELEIPEEHVADYLHRALMSVAGWSGYVQYHVRNNTMNGVPDSSLQDLLAIRLAYDLALFRQYDEQASKSRWNEYVSAVPKPNDAYLLTNFVLQSAMEHAYQRNLIPALVAPKPANTTVDNAPSVQAAFCIDVRSEPLRRALEAESSTIQTIGFAGFFGFALELVPIGADQGQSQCPVLIKPGLRAKEILDDREQSAFGLPIFRPQVIHRLQHAWKTFKISAVSCFPYVETAGLLYTGKLAKGSLGLASHGSAHHAVSKPADLERAAWASHGADAALPVKEQAAIAVNALQKMGISNKLSRLVLLCGHGSETTNNPYASALNCGACGGHSGEANARVAAAILNSPAVRAEMRLLGVEVPDDTLFLAGLHNTTTDEVTLFDTESVPATFQPEVIQLQGWLQSASQRARIARAAFLDCVGASASHTDRLVRSRAMDWAQTRPEWGLAGNAAFIAAPRSRTKHLDLGGRVFLHDYDPAADQDGSVLQLILTAPVVVGAWINLQYFASTVDNKHFGSGDKTIHNVVGTMGIWQGNSGDLQVGLPLQSVHDGHSWRHEPLRLTVIVEANRSAINQVLAGNEDVRALADNGWLHLMAIEGDRIVRYNGDLHWAEAA